MIAEAGWDIKPGVLCPLNLGPLGMLLSSLDLPVTGLKYTMVYIRHPHLI